jgi:protein-serine/threonine kinase
MALVVMPRFGIGLDLFDRIESAPDGLEPFDIRSLLGQLSDALAFLHTNGIVHRDIKDENVILDGQGHCQLIDFGSAAHWRPGRKWDTFSGTLDYASPEILRGEMYSGKEQDVWALGVVGFVMICGETPFLSAEEAAVGLADGSKARNDLMARCGGDRGEEGDEADGGGRMADALDFVERCLELGVDDRPPAEALMEHRFLLGGNGWTGKKGWLTV